MNKVFAQMEKHVQTIAILMVILILGTVGAFVLYNRQVEENNNLTVEIQNLEKQIKNISSDKSQLINDKEKLIEQVAKTSVDYEHKIDAINVELTDLKAKLENSYTIADYIVEGLKTKGYTPATLIETLRENTDIIPYEGVLGGSMQWWPNESYVLNEKWVLGYFEDGHILGYALLEYSFDSNQVVKWKVLNSYIN